jgi:hypothetical protein
MVREKAGASTRSDESRHLEIPAAAEKAPERTARVAKLMGKRSNFLRRANDDYPTLAKAVCPLLPHVKEGRTFIEPCAGAGQLTKHLAEAGLIPLRSYGISQGYDARVIEYPHDAEFFITNPPWTRQLLHPIIVNLKRQKPTWLLFDADWAHMIQAAPYLSFCRKIVSVGRVKWIENSSSTGRDNAAWYLFENEPGATLWAGGARGSVRTSAQVESVWQQACRQRWRALLLAITVKFASDETASPMIWRVGRC